MTAEVHYLGSARINEPPVPRDPYSAELEARVISLASAAMVERAGSSVRAMDFAQALMIYRRHRRGMADEPAEVHTEAANYLRTIEAYLRTLPEEVLGRLRHPALGRDRARQQQLFRRAAQLALNTSQGGSSG